MSARRRRRPIVIRLLVAYFESGTPNYAAGLAFNAFLTMFPIVLGLLSIVGFVIHDQAVFREVERVVIEAFPHDAQNAVSGTLRDASRHAGTIGLISVAGLLYSGTALFASLEFALNQIYDIPGRNPIVQRITGLRLIGIFAVGIVLAVALNVAIGLVNGELLNAAAYLNVIAGWFVITCLLFWIYWSVPNRQLGAREVLPGAIAAGALIELLTLAFPFLFQLIHRASAYTQGFTLVLALSTWLYFMSQLLLMGALFNRIILEERGESVGGVPVAEEPAPIAFGKDPEAAHVKVPKVGR
jgi:membrane protein